MEFHEKLQELRKSRGLTQEELAEALYVSRTAISKWESGRGYPSIDSLKEISKYFSVTIDDLLSGEKLLSIAEKENKANIRNMCHSLFGMVDICSLLLIVLPLYPNTIDGYIYSVNLFAYMEKTAFHRFMYWVLFLSLIVLGIIKFKSTLVDLGERRVVQSTTNSFELLSHPWEVLSWWKSMTLTKIDWKEKSSKIITELSMGIHILLVLFLGMAREAYAITVAFLLFVIKGILFLKYIKAEF